MKNILNRQFFNIFDSFLFMTEGACYEIFSFYKLARSFLLYNLFCLILISEMHKLNSQNAFFMSVFLKLFFNNMINDIWKYMPMFILG